MSSEEGEDVSLTGGDDARPRRRSMKEKAEHASESPFLKLLGRFQMAFQIPIIAGLGGLVLWLAQDKVEHIDQRINDVAAEQAQQGEQLAQIAINQAQGQQQRDDQARAIQEIKENIIRLWDRVTGRKN
ncbi:MAG TPA: hypothetical protein VEC60_09510 [Reyranella sp.]|nr:hypothetical protein [Reyranella sp.]